MVLYKRYKKNTMYCKIHCIFFVSRKSEIRLVQGHMLTFFPKMAIPYRVVDTNEYTLRYGIAVSVKCISVYLIKCDEYIVFTSYSKKAEYGASIDFLYSTGIFLRAIQSTYDHLIRNKYEVKT